MQRLFEAPMMQGAGPAVMELRVSRARPMFILREAQGDVDEQARRLLSVVVATVGLLVAAPLMLAIALAIKLTSPGPVFYTQTRIGMDRRSRRAPRGTNTRGTDLGGRPFRIVKFRTMFATQNEDSVEVWACKDDPRVTAVGRLLRRYRLDELPQLINVIRGDMNIVGPRPEQPKIFASLREQIEGYQSRQAVRPGITGWAQVNHHYDRSVDDVRHKVALDLEYIGRRSAVEDFKIMVRTFPVMVMQRGAH